MSAVILVRYDEIGLKGLNRSFFEKALVRHIEKSWKGFDIKVQRVRGRILVEGEKECLEKNHEILQTVPGIHSYSIAEPLERDVEVWKEKALQSIQSQIDEGRCQTFRVATTRSDKNFPMKSPDVNMALGGHIFTNCKEGSLKVDLKKPEIEVCLEIHQKNAFIYSEREMGIGGLPVPTAGEVLCLLSGGIDSPVAAYQMMRRGCQVHFVFFENRVFLGRAAYQKVEKLANIVSKFQFKAKLHVVPFSDIQVAIRDQCNERYRVILYRRFMFRLAEAIAERNRYMGLVTGESLGQVASQTLENMDAVNRHIDCCVYRPLVAQDKIEIQSIAKKIGTYETSIIDAPDCCSVFMPKRPVTRVRVDQLEEEEFKLDIPALDKKALDEMEVIEIG